MSRILKKAVFAAALSAAFLAFLGVQAGKASAAPGESRYRVEMHWGFVRELGQATEDPALFLPMDGRIAISDGNADTREGIHIISALLFEAGGSYETGHGDSVEVPQERYRARGGVFYPWVAWRSATTADWDGMAVVLAWEQGTDPTVTIETSQWSTSIPASQLPTLAGFRSIGDDGQELETGRFFDLTYKVYDLTLEWGYNQALDQNPNGLPQHLMVWDGSVSLSQGGIRFLHAIDFESGGRRALGRDDAILPREDLSPTLAWRSTTLDPLFRRQEKDGVAMNLVVPKGVTAAISVTIGPNFTRQFILPAMNRDVHFEIPIDNQGHYVHGHLHWCWYKVPEGGGHAH